MNAHDAARMTRERWTDSTLYFHRHRLQCSAHDIALYVECGRTPVVCWTGATRWTECAAWLDAAGLMATTSQPLPFEPPLIIIDD